MLLKCKNFIKEYITSKAKPAITFDLTEIEWKTIEDIVAVLEIPFHATKMLQREDYTMSDFYAEWLLLKGGLRKKAASNISTEAKDLAKQLITSMDEYSAQLLTNPMLAAALFLDPRFTKIMTSTMRMLAISKLIKIWKRMREDESRTLQVQEVNVSNNSKRSDLLEELLDIEENDRAGSLHVSQTTETDDEKIHRLLNEFAELPREKSTVEVLKYWEANKCTKPELFKLSQVVFVVAPTQTPTERSFSNFSHIFQPRRAKIDDDLLRDILIINLNKDLFEQFVQKFLSNSNF